MTKFRHAAVAAISLLMLALHAWAQPITDEEKEDVLKALGQIVTQKAFVPGVDMSQWPTFVEKHREAIDAAEKQEAFARSVNSALRDFGLSHLQLRSPALTKQRDTSSIVGLGIMTQKQEDSLLVVGLMPKGPAAAAGIQAGDKIVEVDGHKPGEPGELRGEEGTEVKLKVAKSDGTETEVRVTRQKFSTIQPDTLSWPEDDVAVLRVHTFAKGYDRELIEKLIDEASDKAKYLIIDLRNNGGGATTNLRHLLSQVLPANSVIGTFISRRAVAEYVKAGKGDGKDAIEVAKWWSRKFRTPDQDPAWEGKIAVLINHASGSASEIAAAGLRDCAGTPLIGQRSAGAVLASVYGALPHGFSVQYPIDDYVTVKGVRLEKHPIEPDFVIQETRRGGPDLAVQKAIEQLKGTVAAQAEDESKAEKPKDADKPANDAPKKAEASDKAEK
jgi:carboxyl-terminal processing protease